MVWEIYSKSERLFLRYNTVSRTVWRQQATVEEMYESLLHHVPADLERVTLRATGNHIPAEVKAFLRGEGDWIPAELETIAELAHDAARDRGEERAR